MSSANTNIMFNLSTPFGDNVLSVDSFEGYEEISIGFRYTLQLSSLDPDLVADNIIGQPVSLTITRPHEIGSQINGIATSFNQVQSGTDMSHYKLTIEPCMALLSHRTNCQIFQEKTVLEIIQAIFDAAGFGSVIVDETSGTHNPRPYTVQYNESDEHFVKRLMAEAGIFFHYRFEDDIHSLVLADDPLALPAIAGDPLPYLLAHREAHSEEGITKFESMTQVRSTAATYRDFNFQTPSKPIESTEAPATDREVYEYPGSYSDQGAGDTIAKNRLMSLQYDGTLYYGHTNSRRLVCGHTFEQIDHLKAELNTNFLILRVAQSGNQTGIDSSHSTHFEAIDATVPFKPLNIYPKPMIPGIQTAIVVGPDGEEIWLDKYGRVKVQFHWDRLGGNNDSSSCWIRVAQMIAGSNWGTMFHPRIGQEVIVQFIGGDVDRPVVTGSLYNEEHMPPYDLPSEGTVSGIKSQSMPGGAADNYNEIRIEDKKGDEYILIHAEKDFISEVENDHKVEIGNNEDRSVEANRKTQIAKNDTLDVDGKQIIKVAKDRNVDTSGNESVSVGKNRTVSVGKNNDNSIDGDNSLNIKKNDSVKIGENQKISIGKKSDISIGDKATLNIDKEYQIQVKEKLVIKVGKASITLKKDGTILLDGKDIKFQGKGAINVKASKDIIMKGKNIKQN